MAESSAPGVVISEVARRHDLRPQQLFAWRHQVRQGRLALPAAELSFVPVVGATDAPSAATPAAPVGMIEVALGGAIVRVPPEVDGKLLAKVLRAVKSVIIRGHAPEQRRIVRQNQSKPIVDLLQAWLNAQLAKVSRRARIAEAIRYALKLWSGLSVFLDDGRIEIDTNVVERSIRPIALNRKNALFAGSDQGGVHWGVIASLIETCKLNAVDPQTYLADALTRLVNRHPASQIDQLMPWAYADPVA